MLRVARIAVTLGLCCTIGGHWFVLQSVAWGAMIVKYSQRTSLTEAVAKTFDGDHPCGICKGIRKAQDSEKKRDLQPASVKPDLICATRTIVLVPRSSDFRFAAFSVEFSMLAHSPPTPPPRDALG